MPSIRRGRKQHHRGPCQPPAQEAGRRGHRDRARVGLPARFAMTMPRSLQMRLGVSLGILLTLLWIAAAAVTAVMLRHEMDRIFDSSLQEAAQRLLPLAAVEIVGREEEGVTQHLADLRDHDEFLTYIVRDDEGRILLQSHEADPAPSSLNGTGRAFARPQPIACTARTPCKARSASRSPSRLPIARRRHAMSGRA
jgi:hypothetical protein